MSILMFFDALNVNKISESIAHVVLLTLTSKKRNEMIVNCDILPCRLVFFESLYQRSLILTVDVN